MDENRLPELPQEAFRPMIAQSVQLEQFLGEELTFCFRDLDGAHTFTTCYGDIYKTVNALRDYVRLLESVCDQWELTGFHRATYEYHAEKLRKIADKLQAGIGYDYDKALPTPMCISTAATSGADSRPEATHGGCLWNEMNYAPL